MKRDTRLSILAGLLLGLLLNEIIKITIECVK